MPTPPTFVGDYEATSHDLTTTPRSSAAFDVANLDALVAVILDGVDDVGQDYTVTNTGTALTWTEQAESTVNVTTSGWAQTATALPTSAQTGITASVARVAGAVERYGFTVCRFSGSDGIGASAASSAASNPPSLSITTTYDNSAIVYGCVDANATDWATRTHRTVNGYTPTVGNGQEVMYFFQSLWYTLCVAYIPDAGAAGTKTVGLTAPAATVTTMVALEVRGSAAGAAAVSTTRPSTYFAPRRNPALQRRARWRPLLQGASPALTTVVSTRATNWTTAAAVTATRATSWTSLASVTATRATTWVTRAAVSATRATTWAVLAAVASTRSSTWNTAAQITATRATTWAALASVAGTRATTWTTLASVASSTRATAWAVAAQVTATRATVWATAAAVISSRATTWSALIVATSTRASTWAVRAAVVSTRATTWAVVATYSSTILAVTGLLAYWRLGEAAASATLVDTSTNARNGTYDSTASSTTGILASESSNTALGMAGATTEGGTVPGATWNTSLTAMAIGFLVKTSGTGLYGLVSRSTAPGFGTVGNVWRTYINAGQITFQLFDTTYNPGATITTTASYNDGATHVVEAHWDGSNIYLYVDGVSAATAVAATGFALPNDTATAIYFGRMAANFPFTGTLDEVWMADRASTGSAASRYALTTSGLTTVTATRATTWVTAGQVTSSRATTWRTLAAVATTRATTWTVYTTTAATRGTAWAVAVRVTATRATAWNAAAAIISSRATTWATLTVATATRASTWAALTSTSTARATTWAVRAAVASTRATQWAVASALTNVVATRATTWNTAAAVSSSRATTWAVRVAVGSTRATTWAVLTATVSTRGTTWTVRQSVAAARATAWAVAAQVTATRATTWDARAVATAARSTTWTVAATVTATRATSWAVATGLVLPSGRILAVSLTIATATATLSIATAAGDLATANAAGDLTVPASTAITATLTAEGALV